MHCPPASSLQAVEITLEGGALEPNFGADIELDFEETPRIQIFGANAAPPSSYEPYIPRRTPTSAGPPGGDDDGDERNSAASGSQSGMPELGQRASTPSALLETVRGASTGSYGVPYLKGCFRPSVFSAYDTSF